MNIDDMHWAQVEDYLKNDDRAILPLGSTEQHAQLSLSTDSIIAQRLALEAAEPFGIPVFPVMNYGLTPQWRRYPGTVSLSIDTYLKLVAEILDGIAEGGFRRILVVSGHGGNQPVHQLLREWNADRKGVRAKYHMWFNDPFAKAKMNAIDPVATHASWAENFPWTRIPGVSMPDRPVPVLERARMFLMTPDEIRAYAGDGNNGGLYQRSDDEMLALWKVAVDLTTAQLEGPWE